MDSAMVKWVSVHMRQILFLWEYPRKAIVAEHSLQAANKVRMIRNDPAHDKTYNKTCVTSNDRSACTSTQYDEGFHLSHFG